MAEQNGTVLNFGTAAAHGSLTGLLARSHVTSIAAMCGAASQHSRLRPRRGRRQGGGARGSRLLRLQRSARHLVAPIVALVPTPDRKGYWLIGADGSVYPFGDAKYEGGAGGKVRPDPVVAAAATPDGRGYWLVTSSGQVMAFGDAENYGSITKPTIGAHVVAIVATADGKGYWIASQHRRRLHLRRRQFYAGEGRHRRPAHRRHGGDARRRRLLARRRERERLPLRRRAALAPGHRGEKARSPRRGSRRHPRRHGSLDGRAGRHRPQPRHGDRPRLAHRRPDHLIRRLHRRGADAGAQGSRLRPRRGQRQGRGSREGRLLRLCFRQAPGRSHHRPRLHP